MPASASRIRQGFRTKWIENVSIPFPHIAEISLIEPTDITPDFPPPMIISGPEGRTNEM